MPRAPDGKAVRLHRAIDGVRFSGEAPYGINAGLVKWYNSGFVTRYPQFDSGIRHHNILKPGWPSGDGSTLVMCHSNIGSSSLSPGTTLIKHSLICLSG
jgi:hypothetical protein